MEKSRPEKEAKSTTRHLSIGKDRGFGQRLRMFASLTSGPAVLVGAIVAGFLIGGIPFGLLVGRLKGIDLRKEGSGNIGATNAYRVLGKGYGIAVFLLDFLKGWLPVLAAGLYLREGPLPDDVQRVLIGVAAVLGHNFSPFLGFKGGKGMATSAGVLLGWVPLALAICLGTWMLTLFATRYVSVASILAGMALPVATVLTAPGQKAFIGASLVLGVMSVWKHRTNIRRLRDGTEHRFVKKKPADEHPQPEKNDG